MRYRDDIQQIFQVAEFLMPQRPYWFTSSQMLSRASNDFIENEIISQNADEESLHDEELELPIDIDNNFQYYSNSNNELTFQILKALSLLSQHWLVISKTLGISFDIIEPREETSVFAARDPYSYFVHFLHPYLENLHPRSAGTYWVIGGAIDRTYESVKLNDKWKKKWSSVKFNDLPEKAQQFIEKYGASAGWPPHVADWHKSAINGWLFSPTATLKGYADFFYDYAEALLSRDNDLSQILAYHNYDKSVSLAWNPSPESSPNSRALFALYKYQQAMGDALTTENANKSLLNFFRGEVAELQHLIEQRYVFDAIYSENMYTQLSAVSLNSEISSTEIDDIQMKIMRYFYRKEFVVQQNVDEEEVESVYSYIVVEINQQFDLQNPDIEHNDATIALQRLSLISDGNDQNTNEDSQIQETGYLDSNYEFSETFAQNETRIRNTHLQMEANALVRLTRFSGFGLFGTRQGASFILPVWGFFKLTRNDNLNIASTEAWEHSIYQNANKIRKMYSLHRFVLDRHAGMPSTNQQSNYLSTSFMTTPNSTVNIFDYSEHTFWENSTKLLNFTSSTAFAEKKVSSRVSDDFGQHSSNMNWMLIENVMAKPQRFASINRVKFKNSLPNIWRRLRTEFAILLNMKFHFEHQLTKLIPNFQKLRGINIFKSAELSLELILVRARFVFTIQSSQEMIAAQWVHINSVAIINSKFPVAKFDFIQLPVSAKYYIYFRWIYSWMLKKKGKLMPRVILIAEARHSTKKKKVTYPDWILTNRYADEDIPSYLEVDFLTMSAVLLTYPKSFDEFDPYLLMHLNVYAPKMLNWKYIT